MPYSSLSPILVVVLFLGFTPLFSTPPGGVLADSDYAGTHSEIEEAPSDKPHALNKCGLYNHAPASRKAQSNGSCSTGCFKDIVEQESGDQCIICWSAGDGGCCEPCGGGLCDAPSEDENT